MRPLAERSPAGAALAAASSAPASRWLESRGTDLGWYVLSSLAGLVYVGIVLLGASAPATVFTQSFFTLDVLGAHFPIGIYALVFLSYSWLFDGTHTFATLARVGFNADERRRYRGVLLRSFGFLGLGPVLVLLALGIEHGLGTTGIHTLAAMAFIVFFQVWGLFHIVRQHWGFVAIYRAKHGERDATSRRGDAGGLYALSFLPLGLFFSSAAFRGLPGMPPLPFAGALGAAHTTLVAVYATLVLGYIAWVARRRLAGHAPNPQKLALMTAFGGLVLLVFSDPRLAVCMTPILGIGHNLQYHRIVWLYGNRKVEPQARSLPFRNVVIYLGLGLAFTWLLYRGPLSEWLFAFLAPKGGVTSMIRAMENPAALTLAQELFGAFLIGFGCQHYYLDGKIWKLRSDAKVRAQLEVAS